MLFTFWCPHFFPFLLPPFHFWKPIFWYPLCVLGVVCVSYGMSCTCIWVFMLVKYMEIHVYSILAKKEQKEEKENQPPHTQHKQTNTHIHTPKRAGHRMPSLENWDGGLKIFCGMPTCQLKGINIYGRLHCTHLICTAYYLVYKTMHRMIDVAWYMTTKND